MPDRAGAEKLSGQSEWQGLNNSSMSLRFLLKPSWIPPSPGKEQKPFCNSKNMYLPSGSCVNNNYDNSNSPF